MSRASQFALEQAWFICLLLNIGLITFIATHGELIIHNKIIDLQCAILILSTIVRVCSHYIFHAEEYSNTSKTRTHPYSRATQKHVMTALHWQKIAQH
ncbi:MAG: hypothetical protein EZS28_035180 [Streblomastix strix]|uniref:Uncharacterized protein n=1 Tax=Streblomastix strix TaxID=222440 RepID=A0A5J4UGD5_9EUKA|nr:MAG: hypothetical protein EZS28_035180 [Streblomastix strix]